MFFFYFQCHYQLCYSVHETLKPIPITLKASVTTVGQRRLTDLNRACCLCYVRVVMAQPTDKTFTHPSYLNTQTPRRYLQSSTCHMFNRKLHHPNFLKITGRRKAISISFFWGFFFFQLHSLTSILLTLNRKHCCLNYRSKVNYSFKKREI